MSDTSEVPASSLVGFCEAMQYCTAFATGPISVGCLGFWAFRMELLLAVSVRKKTKEEKKIQKNDAI